MGYNFDDKDPNTRISACKKLCKKFELMKKENIGLMFYGPVEVEKQP